MKNVKRNVWLMLMAIMVVAARIAPAQTPTPQAVWDVAGAGDQTIQGFTTQMSYNVGQTAQFKINTNASAYHLDIYRIGYYGGNGAALITTVNPSASLPQTQPACINDATTRLTDCGNWAVSASWAIPANAKSGVYFARAIRNDTSGASHIFFVVRDDASTSNVLFQTSDATWQAYNQYGGSSMYGTQASPFDNTQRAYKVSYNRPITTRGWNTWSFFFNAEYPMIRWLEANGYDVSYTSEVDSDQRGNLIKNHKVFMSVGHDEYWSAGQRTNVLAARDAGVHLMFLSGNEIFWKTRYENSFDGSSTPYRTLVCYKETHANAKIDPTSAWTGTWRDPRFSPPADGGQPENQLTGTIFTVNGVNPNMTLQVPDTDGKMRFWRNTTVATLAPGATAALTPNTLGAEWDESLDNGFRPAGLFYLSTASYNVSSYLLDYGSTYGVGTGTHHLTIYKAASGALVFGSGTMQYAWGLDSTHDGPSNPAADVRLQQATVNLLADMGSQPASLQPGLVAATASADATAPSAAITSPANGANVPGGVLYTITGTATDAGGGVVAAIEVSTDGGTTWHPATGRASWTYNWLPVGASAIIKARAIDDSGNIQPLPASVSVNIADNIITIWNGGGAPALVDSADPNGVELGLKFKSDVAGVATGALFYKSAANTGTHVGNLWSSAGALLATVTFANETASGWQQANFSTPVTIAANTTYVISYHTNTGHYSFTGAYFAAAGFDNVPLHALSNAAAGGNGVYLYGAGGFPSQTYNSANYWVDVAFQQNLGNPVITGIAATTTPTTATITWTTDIASNSRVDYGTSAGSLTLNQSSATLVNVHSITLTGLTPGTTYYYRVTSTGSTSNTTTSPASPAAPLTFATTTSPIVISNLSVAPTGTTATVTWTTNVASDSRVDFGTSNVFLLQNQTSAAMVTSHSIILTGLTGATTYYYRVTSVDAASNSMTQPPTSVAPNSFSTTDATPPVVTAITATPGAGGSAVIQWTTDEASTSRVDYGTSAGSLTLNVSNATLVTSHAITLSGLTTGTTYYYRVTSADASNNSATSPVPPATNNFVESVVATLYTIFTPSSVPGTVNWNDSNAVELGVKFKSDVAGQITSIRFYKGSQDIGTHTGSLWSAAGALLANVTFTGESASGWQQADFSSPVSIAANTTYVASYHTSGHYAGDAGYFVVAADNPPLHGLSNAVAAGNGVYLYGGGGFPNQSFNSANYWVDVVMVTTPLVPAISSFTPTSGFVGSSVVITGANFSGATTVAFNAVAATAFTVNSSTQITATVPTGATTGPISVTTTSGTGTSASSFTVSVPAVPTIASFTPTSGPVGTSATIFGTNFTGATGVSFNNVPATSFVVNTSTQITATVPSGASSGTIKVTAPGGTATSSTSFTVTVPAVPTIASFTPSSGVAGTSVVVTGTNFSGASVVSFNSVAATFNVDSATQITATVPAGTSSGPIRVTTAGGTAVSANNFTAALTIFTTQTPGTVNWADANAVELGVKFRVDSAATVTGVRFFKGSQDIGTHTGTLWSSAGVLLTTVTFTGETASGWQQANFSTPVAISANTTYIVSYHTSGHYAGDGAYFAAAGVNNGALHALQNGVDGGNGVYLYGPGGGFPNNTFNSANYWVDVVLTIP